MKSKHDIYNILKNCIIEKEKEEQRILPANDEKFLKEHKNKLFKLNVKIELLEHILEVD